MAMLLVASAKLAGLYDRDETLLHKTTLEEAPKLFYLASMCTLVAWLSAGALHLERFDRQEVLWLWAALSLLLIGARAMARALGLRICAPERCLFIGDAPSATAIRSRMGEHGGVKARMVAHLDLNEASSWSVNTLSAPRLEEIRDLARELDIHRAIIAPDSADAGEMLDLIRTLKAIGVKVSVLPRLLEVVGCSVEFDDLHGITVMGVRRFDLTGSSRTLKRGFDLLGASVGLLVLSPLMILMAIAIKLEDRGPVFFRQSRVGQNGKHFHMLKFRTMVDGAEAMKESLRAHNEAQDGLFKIVDDPRVTQVGKLLRKSSLDELPQLLNVLTGEMSLVGPRPLVIDEDEQIEGWHRRRLELMPGMTGPWQILGPSRVPLREMMAIDYLYVANWSLWTDIKILVRTVAHVAARRGI